MSKFTPSSQRKIPDDYHNLATSRGFKWLGPEVTNTNTKTGWQCPHDHQWIAIWDSIKAGSGCPHCAGNQRKPPEDYHNLAKGRDYIWLGPMPTSVGNKTSWQCAKGHTWITSYASIKRGNGCHHCSGKFPKNTQAYELLAKDRNFILLGSVPANSKEKTTWQCAKGHVFESSYLSVRHSSHGCAQCGYEAGADANRIKPDEYHKVARVIDFEWLGPEVSSVKAKTNWECTKGHVFTATYSGFISSKHKCPQCANEAVSIAHRIKPEGYHVVANKRGFTWLGPEVPNSGTITKWQCPEGHTWETTLSSIKNAGTGCPTCAQEIAGQWRRIPPEQYHSTAAERGFTWLGPYPKNTNDLSRWRCHEGHEWDSSYGSVGNQGTGCPYCAGKATKVPKDYHNLAEKRGFRWIGEFPHDTGIHTEWQCAEGHSWSTAYGTINQGAGCPHCGGTYPKSPTDYLAVATQRGFTWLGPKPPSVRDKTGWQCQHGHIWQAPYDTIGNSERGCPYCAGVAKKTAGDYAALADQLGIFWLGPIPKESRIKTKWQCQPGHKFEISYQEIQGFEVPCPICQPHFRSKIPEHYEIIASENNLTWLGPMPQTVIDNTQWQCPNGHTFERRYDDINQGTTACPTCGGYVNGVATSQPQRDLHEMLGGELNYPAMGYYLDIALFSDLAKIVVEYDSWYYHQDRLDNDIARDDALIAAGWRVLRVKAGTQLPTLEQLDEAIARLLDGEVYVEIVMDEWRDHIG